MEVKATLQYLGIAPRKTRLVAAAVKGMDVARAERQLRQRSRRAAPVLLKLLRSAAADARHNFSLEEKNLRIKEVRVDAGPATKRFRARAFGRAASIRRRTSHVSLVLETIKDAAVLPVGTRQAPLPPAVREATAEDLRKSAGFRRNSPSDGDEVLMQRQRSLGFVRRIFQRKAI